MVLIAQQFVRYIDKAASGEIASTLVLQFLGVQTLSYLSLVVPGGLFAAAVYALARMYREHEMVALAAAGIGPLRVVRTLALIALVLLPVAAYLSLEVSPWAERWVHQTKRAQRESVDVLGLIIGRFAEFNHGRTVYFVGGRDEVGHLQNLFFQRQLGTNTEIVTAREGLIETDPESAAKSLVLLDGARYVGEAGRADYEVAKFARYQLYFAATDPSSADASTAGTPSLTLWESDDPAARGEWHRRLASVFALPVLLLAALPIARVPPRGNVHGRMLIALAVYVLYSNLTTIGARWLSQEVIPGWLGLWWVHLLIAIGALLALDPRWLRLRRVRR